MSTSSGDDGDRMPPEHSDERPADPDTGGSEGRPTGELVFSPSGVLMLPYGGGSADGHFFGMAVGEQLDAFRELRTRLQAMGAGVGLQRFTVLVVSIERGSGASFIARNLAVAFTLQEQRRAVLIDCNLRNPTQHIAFDLLGDSDGLFDYLENPHFRPERLLFRTELAGLYLIPAGRPSSSACEYFSSYAMRTLLDSLRQRPSYLVLDGPPVKGSPDARILSELADFVVLVAGYGRDTVDGIAQAAALFDPAKFAGVVFNDRD
jgi:Mrp family chromosome partitioning ATPase